MSASAGIEPHNLRTERQFAPLGVGAARPRLGWELRGSRPGARQNAWQVEVRRLVSWAGSDAVALGDCEPEPCWDTGKRPGDAASIRYGGSPLASRSRLAWRVRAWDELDLPSDWSPLAAWEMGLLEQRDWVARWIEPEQEAALPEPVAGIREALAPEEHSGLDRRDKLRPCRLVRRAFRVEKALRGARLYATAHGVYRATLNGRDVDDRVLAPEASAYQGCLYYQTYDVGALLRADRDPARGENVLAFAVADGWWAGRIGLPGASCQYGDRLGILFQLELLFADGERRIVASDGDCLSSRGGWDYADLFIGERYDARLARGGWDLPGFDPSGWTPVGAAEYGLSNLAAQHGEPLRRLEELPVARVMTTPRGETLLDFGQVVAGRIRLRCERPAGTAIVLDHSECLDPNGDFFSNIVGRNKDQRDIYVCAGSGVEEWEPSFTYHGFRYVRVRGDLREGMEERYRAIVLGSDLRRTGRFACSDGRINRLYENILWSQRANFFSIPTDCPQRERAGFTGDAQVFAETAAFNQDVQVFFERWLRNLAIEQRPDGEVPNLVPYWRSYIETFHAMQGSHSSAGWGDAVILVPWRLYRMSGDLSLLEESYPAMSGWLSYVEAEAAKTGPEHLWNTGFHFGDWLRPSAAMAGQDPFAIAAATREITATCCYAYSVSRMAQVAAALGRLDDEARYKSLFADIKRAFAEAYLDEAAGLRADFQGAFILALAADLVPEPLRAKVLDQLARSIADYGTRLDAGFVSIPFLMDTLSDNGLAGLAYDLLFQVECPSWLYEVERGATTIWESWSGVAPDGTVGAFSFNHYAFGCVGQWLYRAVAGIDPIEPGFRRIRARPLLDGRLTWAEARYHSDLGPIGLRWEREGAVLRLRLELPPGCEAEVEVPGAAPLSSGQDGSGILKAASGVSEFRFRIMTT